MTNDFILAKNAIKAKLDEISNVKYVYTYEKGLLEGYPAVTIYSAEYNPEWISTEHDKDTYIYTIHLYQEMSADNKGASKAEGLVDNALVAILQAFQQDYRLGGVVDKLTISAKKGWTDRELVNRAGVITIVCQKLVKIS